MQDEAEHSSLRYGNVQALSNGVPTQCYSRFQSFLLGGLCVRVCVWVGGCVRAHRMIETMLIFHHKGLFIDQPR